MNCTADDVRKIIHTSLSDTDIESIIAMSDSMISKRAGARITGELARKLSALVTASTIKTRQPDSTSISEYRESSENIQKVWANEIEKIYRLFSCPAIAVSSYQSIKEDERYTEEA